MKTAVMPIFMEKSKVRRGIVTFRGSPIRHAPSFEETSATGNMNDATAMQPKPSMITAIEVSQVTSDRRRQYGARRACALSVRKTYITEDIC